MSQSSKRYRVIAPYVTFKTSGTLTGEPAILGFHEGGLVPEDAEPDAIRHHLDRGLIEEIPDKAMPVAAPRGNAGTAPPSKGGPVKTGDDTDAGTGTAAAKTSTTTPATGKG